MTVTEKRGKRRKDPSFGEAVGEVEQILARLEGEQVDIDDLSREVKRAVELIKLCRRKLAKTDGEVRALVADLRAEAEGVEDGTGSTADQSAQSDEQPLPPPGGDEDSDVPF
jgi:exodeoxyribonuclease VII small subunit